MGAPESVLANPCFLVHGECRCGWAAALPEGAKWPVCPECGEQVSPPRATRMSESENRMGYLALRMRESAAVEAVWAAHRASNFECYLD